METDKFYVSTFLVPLFSSIYIIPFFFGLFRTALMAYGHMEDPR